MNIIADKFGEFVVRNLRDKAIKQHKILLCGQLKGKYIQELQSQVVKLPDEYKQLIESIVIDIIDTAAHDLLYAIQDGCDRDIGIDVIVDGHNVAKSSGMLHGEYFGEGGWVKRYSEYANLGR